MAGVVSTPCCRELMFFLSVYLGGGSGRFGLSLVIGFYWVIV